MAVRKHVHLRPVGRRSGRDGLFDAARGRRRRRRRRRRSGSAARSGRPCRASSRRRCSARKTIVDLRRHLHAARPRCSNALVQGDRPRRAADRHRGRAGDPPGSSQRGRPDRRARRAGRGAGRRRRSAARVAAHAPRPHPAGRAARPRGLRLPARRQQRPSRLDHHRPCRQPARRARPDRAPGDDVGRGSGLGQDPDLCRAASST